jgi:hypothetical protein
MSTTTTIAPISTLIGFPIPPRMLSPPLKPALLFRYFTELVGWCPSVKARTPALAFYVLGALRSFTKSGLRCASLEERKQRSLVRSARFPRLLSFFLMFNELVVDLHIHLCTK